MSEYKIDGCAVCGRTDCRLYRPYGDFYRAESIRCNAHLPERAWRVPSVQIGKNMAQDYGALSAEQIAEWRAKPESDPNGWTRESGSWLRCAAPARRARRTFRRAMKRYQKRAQRLRLKFCAGDFTFFGNRIPLDADEIRRDAAYMRNTHICGRVRPRQAVQAAFLYERAADAIEKLHRACGQEL